MGKELLQWYKEIGVDEAVSCSPVNKLETPVLRVKDLARPEIITPPAPSHSEF